jgi:hypothetical protein
MREERLEVNPTRVKETVGPILSKREIRKEISDLSIKTQFLEVVNPVDRQFSTHGGIASSPERCWLGHSPDIG